MPNIKQQKKRMRQDIVRTERNRDLRSRVRTYIKKARSAIEAGGSQDELNEIVKRACSAIDRAATKGVMHKNAASRKKSSLQRAVSSK